MPSTFSVQAESGYHTNVGQRLTKIWPETRSFMGLYREGIPRDYPRKWFFRDNITPGSWLRKCLSPSRSQRLKIRVNQLIIVQSYNQVSPKVESISLKDIDVLVEHDEHIYEALDESERQSLEE